MTQPNRTRASSKAQNTDAMARKAGRRPRKTATTAEAAPVSPSGKIATLIDLLSRPQGADLSELMAATGWQAHSVRGAIAGTLKKRRSLNIISELADQRRIYRVLDSAAG